MIESQALVWLGSAFAPLLPAVGLLSNVLHFYTQKLLATFLYQPPDKPYTASRTSNVAYSLMLGTHRLDARLSNPAKLSFVALVSVLFDRCLFSTQSLSCKVRAVIHNAAWIRGPCHSGPST